MGLHKERAQGFQPSMVVLDKRCATAAAVATNQYVLRKGPCVMAVCEG